MGEMFLLAHQDGTACQARPGTICSCHGLHLFSEMLKRGWQYILDTNNDIPVNAVQDVFKKGMTDPISLLNPRIRGTESSSLKKQAVLFSFAFLKKMKLII